MTDRVNTKTRSKVMAAVKSKGTKLEDHFKKELKKRQIKGYIENPLEVLGRPDFVFLRIKVAVFLDSCFWHGCPQHLRMPSTNQEYWLSKIARNRKRDREVTKQLKKNGWYVIRIWEHSASNHRSLKWYLTYLEKMITVRKNYKANQDKGH